MFKQIPRRLFSATIKVSEGKPLVSCPNQLLIDGKWVNAASGKTIDTLDPATGKKIVSVAAAGAKDVDLAVQAAQNALRGPWAKVSGAQRAILINRFADALEKAKDELVQLECTDNGKAPFVAAHDVDFAVQIFRYNAGAAERLEGLSFTRDAGEFTNNFGYVRQEPVGVAGCITPWNFPLLMTTFKMAPMLASGCTGLFKTPELTPLSSLKMAEIWTNLEGSVPGVINMLPGTGEEAGESIVDHAGVNSIHFTGSTAIGQRIMSRAATTLKRVKLELGGKSPLIVFDDADIKKAATIGAIHGSINSGQFCAAPTRFFVHEKVHDEFVANVVAILQGQKYGRWDEPGVFGGPLVSQKQLDRVLSYIKSGVEEGATLVTGGKQIERPGYFVQPTVFTNCTDSMKIVREEIFGPVISILKFSDTEEVIKRANDSKYGLVGGVFSANQRTCHHVAKHLQVGFVNVNNYFQIGVQTPFGGYKQSGVGREMSHGGVQNFLETKTIIYDCN